jgi:hypothetical protein
MALPSSSVQKQCPICPDCGAQLEVVLFVNRFGWCFGRACLQCGFFTRESNYYRTFDEAEHALKKATVG